ncbi:MAG TPA: phosphoglycerate dehydrogenase [Nitrospinota bacterium]|nr:phosphoglycerate dehydrogenase [Nitrospinota bacterium]|tara:strand:+ start:190002 stop:191594 length:1593 start_codon:yes stop_codon:yes gene_type:complete
MSIAKVLVSDKLSENGIKILRDTPGIEVDVKTGMSPDELLQVIPQYNGLIIRSATKVTTEVLDAATNLKVVGRAGIGVDNVDIKAASAKGVVVMNTPGGNTNTTAEHAISMMMALCRQIPQATASVKGGKWEKKRFMGMELFNKTLGVVGIGRIGSIVVARARGLAMKVIAFDPFISDEAAEKMAVEKVTLDDLFARADIISCHTPLTDETRHIIGDEAFAKMKDGVRIINCARGGIVDETALAKAIKSGKVAGAAIDVFETEPPDPELELLEMEEVIFTPHLGASTSEAQEKVALAVAEQFVEFFNNGMIINAINMPQIDPEQLAKVRPYLSLAEQMGAFTAQIAEGGLKRVQIEYMGELSNVDQRPITQAILKGILTCYVGPSVNLVNAPYLADSRGVTVSAATSSVKRNFASLLGLRLITETDDVYVEGTVFISGKPRLVKLQEVIIEAQLEGNMIIFTNDDKPGVIGNVGAYLGDAGVNIAAFHLGRESVGGRAISIVNVDQQPTQSQLSELGKIENIIDVKLASL